MRAETETFGQPFVASDKKYLQKFSDEFHLTEREAEILEKLVTTEDGVQEIADTLYISRRNLQRYIASIYEKTGAKSRIGVLQTYMTLVLEENNVT
ncbi:MAG: LuxR C-terminal-related transcriptional regulator [Wujia sp.]